MTAHAQKKNRLELLHGGRERVNGNQADPLRRFLHTLGILTLLGNNRPRTCCIRFHESVAGSRGQVLAHLPTAFAAFGGRTLWSVPKFPGFFFFFGAYLTLSCTL